MDNKKIAILILAYSDYESLEIALAAHSKFLPKGVKLFILQNGRGTYDCERTYKVAQRYHNLYPRQIEVVDWISPQAPYLSIKELLNSKKMEDFDYICKMDDDTFPLTPNWFEQLCSCYENSYKKYGENLGYVTSLVNNNPWGFPRVLQKMNLADEYFNKYAMVHESGMDNGDVTLPYFIVSKNRISTSGCGTIWRNAYISRWLHKRVSLNPDLYINACSKEEYVEVDNTNRYSINCMLFKKSFWNDIGILGTTDDEKNCALYCAEYNKIIISNLAVPMVHLFFYAQRDENKDLIPEIRNYYEKWLDLPYPISICPNKDYENENRLRFIENQNNIIMNPVRPNNPWYQNIFSIKNRYNANNIKKKVLTILGFKITIKSNSSIKRIANNTTANNCMKVGNINNMNISKTVYFEKNKLISNATKKNKQEKLEILKSR